MLPRRARTIALACCAGAAAAVLLTGPLTRQAPAQEAQPAAANPMAGDGMWIWYVSRAEGGDVGRIAKKAQQQGHRVRAAQVRRRRQHLVAVLALGW